MQALTASLFVQLGVTTSMQQIFGGGGSRLLCIQSLQPLQYNEVYEVDALSAEMFFYFILFYFSSHLRLYMQPMATHSKP